MNSSKEVMFLGELEEVLEATQDVEFKLKHAWTLDQAVQSLTLNVRKVFCDLDQVLFDECLVKFQVEEEDKTEVKAKRKRTWKRSEDLADKAVMVPRLVSSVNLASIFESTG
ncbi:hypothetical protein BRARA_C03844 [Brassica rapa]|uniref:Uncharacterized protein n=1 Tax=Brassica campestris TaxID=3711 RepID=A0A398A297_BRACM|nr:hypothetical protein BRARA_C03844 [Brassica rapa]